MVATPDITYCLNPDCPFTDCMRHSDNAPSGVPVSMAWLDGTCRRYIGWLVDIEKEVDGNG